MLTLLVSLEEYLTQLKPNITVCVHVLLKQFSFVISCNQLYGPSWRHVVEDRRPEMMHFFRYYSKTLEY